MTVWHKVRSKSVESNVKVESQITFLEYCGYTHIHTLSKCVRYKVRYGTVPLNYSFISISVDTCGNTQYFTCKMLKFAVKIIISMRRVVEFS